MFLFNFFAAIVAVLLPVNAFAEYTPLITSTTFDGVRIDVTTTAVGILSVLVIIVGLSLIVRAFTH